MKKPKQEKPIICTWLQLCHSLKALHHYEKAYVDRLHDIWKLGAPTPTSRVINLKGYDPRIPQVGNHEARIVFPKKLAEWVTDAAKTRGIEMTPAQARQLLDGLGRILAGKTPNKVRPIKHFTR